MEVRVHKALITGHKGFLGRHLARYLIEGKGDYRISGIDKLDGSRFDLASGESQTLLDAMVEWADEVYHLAGNANLLWAEQFPVAAMDDVIAAARVLEACHRAGKRVVVVSSVQAYGLPEKLPIEESAVLNPCTTYGVVKSLIEKLCALYWGKGLRVSVARLANIYGPDQEKAVTYLGTVVTDTMKVLGSSKPRRLNLVGRDVSRDFVYVGDVVDALFRICSVAGQGWTYNVGSGQATHLEDLMNLIAATVGYDDELAIGPGRIDDPGFHCEFRVDNSRLRRLGWEPKIGLALGLYETWEAMKRKQIAEDYS